MLLNSECQTSMFIEIGLISQFSKVYIYQLNMFIKKMDIRLFIPLSEKPAIYAKKLVFKTLHSRHIAKKVNCSYTQNFNLSCVY